MKKRSIELPDLTLLRSVVAPEILRTAELASPHLLKWGKVDLESIDQHLEEYAPQQTRRWERVKDIAAREE
jgi:hypothetical protein